MKLSELPLSTSALPLIETVIVDLTSDCGTAAEIVVSVGLHVAAVTDAGMKIAVGHRPKFDQIPSVAA